MSECAVCEGSGGWARDGGREEVTCEACNGCGSTPDAAPVEVEGGRGECDLTNARAAAAKAVSQRDHTTSITTSALVGLLAELDRRHSSPAQNTRILRRWAERERRGFGAGTAEMKASRLEAAADEIDRLRALPAAPTTPDIADERVRALAAKWADKSRSLPESGTADAYARCAHELLAALATPSTPGAGQEDPFAAVKALPEWEALLTELGTSGPRSTRDYLAGRFDNARAIRPAFPRYRTGGTVVSGDLDHYGDCPSCGNAWGYVGSDGTGQFSHLTGRVEHDRVQEWMCPFCGAAWDRWTGNQTDAGRPPTPTPTDQTKERNQ